MSVHAFHQVGVLEIQIGGIGGNNGTFAQCLTQAPHIKFGGKTLNFRIGTVFQIIRQGVGIYLIAELVASRCRIHTVERSRLRHGAQDTYNR